MSNARDLDINTAYASLAGTRKHAFVSATSPSAVRDIAQICYQLAGSKEDFCARPFLSINVNHAVPLRFDAEALDVMIEAVQCGIPVMVNTFGQLGASSPVTIAGCLAQTMAETLAGMVIAWLADPAAKAVFGPRPGNRSSHRSNGWWCRGTGAINCRIHANGQTLRLLLINNRRGN